MRNLVFLKNVAARIAKRSNSLFECPVEIQTNYIERFKTPKDDFERSYYQYRCQMKLNGVFTSWLLNIVSLPLILYYSLKKNDELSASNVEAVFISEGIRENVIPKELHQEFMTWATVNVLKEYYTAEDKKMFHDLCKRYPFAWHFLLKSLIKIRIYSYLKVNYSPKAIVVCSEYSFTSSVLTYYCTYSNIEHINVMHGEKLFYIRDSFFRFHRCYIWNEYYKRLFISLKAEENQFVIKVPESLVIGAGDKSAKEIDYTYYLGGETGENLQRIGSAVQALQKRGAIVAIRPHPRYSDMEEVSSVFAECVIENSDHISIEESILRTRNVVSLYSTVLNQAYHSKINVVIDDVSNPEMFKQLHNLRYVMLNVEHKLLSQEIMS